MASLGKSPHVPGIRPAIRQDRGPGMNLGLKKPRFGHIAKPKPVSEQMPKSNTQQVGSYLPDPSGVLAGVKHTPKVP